MPKAAWKDYSITEASSDRALEQGRMSLAERLKPAFKAAREVELKFQAERRSAEKRARSA